MSTLPENRDGKTPAAEKIHGGTAITLQLPLSRWTMPAFVCAAMTALAATLGGEIWASMQKGVHENDPSKLIEYFGKLFAGILLFFGTPVFTLVGAVCAWLGLRRRPVQRGVAITALVLNLAGLCFFLFFILG